MANRLELTWYGKDDSSEKSRLFPKKHWNIGERKFFRRKYPVMLYMGYIGNVVVIMRVGAQDNIAKERCKQWKMKKTYYITKGKRK